MIVLLSRHSSTGGLYAGINRSRYDTLAAYLKDRLPHRRTDALFRLAEVLERLTPGQEFQYFSADHHSPTDPGGHVRVQRSVEGSLISTPINSCIMATSGRVFA